MDLAKLSAAQHDEGETNDITVRSYVAIGAIQALGKVEVEAREAGIPDRHYVAYFVRVSAETMDEYPQTGVALVPLDKVPKLISSLEKLEGAQIATDRFAFTEIEYEVDGLKIIVFTTAGGR